MQDLINQMNKDIEKVKAQIEELKKELRSK